MSLFCRSVFLFLNVFIHKTHNKPAAWMKRLVFFRLQRGDYALSQCKNKHKHTPSLIRKRPSLFYTVVVAGGRKRDIFLYLNIHTFTHTEFLFLQSSSHTHTHTHTHIYTQTNWQGVLTEVVNLLAAHGVPQEHILHLLEELPAECQR